MTTTEREVTHAGTVKVAAPGVVNVEVVEALATDGVPVVKATTVIAAKPAAMVALNLRIERDIIETQSQLHIGCDGVEVGLVLAARDQKLLTQKLPCEWQFEVVAHEERRVRQLWISIHDVTFSHRK